MATMIPIDKKIDEILKNNQLSVTAGRRKMLELFLKNKSALEHADFEKKTGESFDRVTIYRTLQSFLEKGIIHSIPASDNSVKYALCNDSCGEGHHHDNHVHFICNECKTATCLEEVTIPDVKLPSGFTQTNIQILIAGTCSSCQ